jgi:hypothetical protein
VGNLSRNRNIDERIQTQANLARHIEKTIRNSL